MRHPFLTIILAALALGACNTNQCIVRHTDSENTQVTIAGTPKYLLLPIEDRGQSARVDLRQGDSLLQRLYIRLARTQVDYYVPLDLEHFPTMTSLDIRLDSTAMCWDSIRVADKFAPRHDPLRPLWHHTPPYGWMNDPNGMFYLNGEWHLYYQFNPYGNRHGNIHWGHSVSTDLVNWRNLPPAIEPDSLGSVASGSCVVDHLNSAGFGKDAVVAFYTAWGPPQVQCLAYSTDGGYTFTKYEGNPILTSPIRDFRDPKVFYHSESERWIMILAVGHHMEFYSSANLKEWSYESSFGEGYGGHGGVWECPDLLRLPIEGEPDRFKWTLICNINPGGPAGGSATQYFTGEFDGHQFICDTPPHITRWMDFGKDNYASVSWNNAPDGRNVIIGWMSNWNYCGSVPTTAFRSANTIARDLYLYTDGDVNYLGSRPAPEMEAALGEPTHYESRILAEIGEEIPIASADKGYRLNITLRPSKSLCGFSLANAEGEKITFIYNPTTRLLTIDRTHYQHPRFSSSWDTPAAMWYDLKGEPTPIGVGTPEEQIAVPATSDKHLRLSLWVDRSSVECFERSGRFVLTTTAFPQSPFDRIIPFAEQACEFSEIEVRNIVTTKHQK